MRSVFETRPFGGWVAGTSRPETALMPVPLENPRWGLISDPPNGAAGYSCRTVVAALVVSPGAAQAHPGAAPRIGADPSHSRRRGYAVANHQMISPYKMITPGWRHRHDPGTSAAPERPAWAGRPAGRGIAAPGQPDRNPATGCPEGGQNTKAPEVDASRALVFPAAAFEPAPAIRNRRFADGACRPVQNPG